VVRSPPGETCFSISTLGSTEWVPGALYIGIKRPVHEANIPPSSAEIKNIWIYTSTPIRLHGVVMKHRQRHNSVAGFQYVRPGFDPSSGHVGFVVDKVALGQVSSQCFGFPLKRTQKGVRSWVTPVRMTTLWAERSWV
jgi:hypothetical protein